MPARCTCSSTTPARGVARRNSWRRRRALAIALVRRLRCIRVVRPLRRRLRRAASVSSWGRLRLTSKGIWTFQVTPFSRLTIPVHRFRTSTLYAAEPGLVEVIDIDPLPIVVEQASYVGQPFQSGSCRLLTKVRD